jgi:hypothetical protein
MILSDQCLDGSVTQYSSGNEESVCKRKPRFQRQKSNNKCECNSNSRNR